MKPYKKILILCVAFVLMATKVLAGDVVIVKKLNGVVSSDAGNVEAVVNEAVCTLTVYNIVANPDCIQNPPPMLRVSMFHPLLSLGRKYDSYSCRC